MNIKINGQCRCVDLGLTVAELMKRENMLMKGGVAVALNGRVVRRADWDMRILQEGDELLIINAAYGG